MRLRFALALGTAALALAAGAARADQFVGPENSFTVEFDENWKAIQSQTRGGLTCTEKGCGGDRVFCLVLPRSDPEAQMGEPLPDEIVKRFGAGVISAPPPNVKMEYVSDFKDRTFGSVVGSWAEVKSTSDKGVNHFGMFLFATPGYDIALQCGAPEAHWEQHRPKIEKLLTSISIPLAAPAKPPAEGDKPALRSN